MTNMNDDEAEQKVMKTMYMDKASKHISQRNGAKIIMNSYFNSMAR